LSRKAHESLQELLAGSVAYVPATLLTDGRVSDSGVRLYALVRALGPGRDTFRGKDSLAEALGWSRRKLYRVASSLEDLGWLDRTTTRKGSSWVSTWSVRKGLRVSPVALRANSGTVTNGTVGVSPVAQGGVSPVAQENQPPANNQPKLWEGLSSSIEEKTLSVHELWGCLPSWDRDHAPAGWETLADSLVEVLDRKALPKGTTQATLALAFVDRIRSRKPLRGITSGEGLLIGAARERCDADDVLELQELLARRPSSEPTPPEPVGSESIPPEVLAGLADSLALPGTRTPLRARERA